MVSLLGLIIGIAALLAVIVTAGIVGACLGVAWLTDTFRGTGNRPQRGAHGRQQQRGMFGRQPQRGMYGGQPQRGMYGRQPQRGAYNGNGPRAVLGPPAPPAPPSVISRQPHDPSQWQRRRAGAG